MREKGWRKRVAVRAVEILQPEWSRDLGERPATVKGGRAWDRAVEQVVEYRQQHNVTDPERPLGPEPHGKDISLEQRRAWRHAMGGRSTACATWRATTPSDPTGWRRPVATQATVAATAGNQTTATASAPCRWWSRDHRPTITCLAHVLTCTSRCRAKRRLAAPPDREQAVDRALQDLSARSTPVFFFLSSAQSCAELAKFS